MFVYMMYLLKNSIIFLFGCAFEFRFNILICFFIYVTFNFVFVFDYTLSIFYFFLLFIFILLNEQKNEARKLTRLKKFKRGTPKTIKFSAELASLKQRENFITFQ